MTEILTQGQIGRLEAVSTLSQSAEMPIVNSNNLQKVTPKQIGNIIITATGTFTCNETTPVVVAQTAITANSGILPTLKTVGGTVGAIPAVKTITPTTGFTIAGTAGDTSVYNYHVIEYLA